MLVESLGYVPGVCWKILRIHFQVEHLTVFREEKYTLLGTNIGMFESMIFLFRRWDLYGYVSFLEGIYMCIYIYTSDIYVYWHKNPLFFFLVLGSKWSGFLLNFLWGLGSNLTSALVVWSLSFLVVLGIWSWLKTTGNRTWQAGESPCFHRTIGDSHLHSVVSFHCHGYVFCGVSFLKRGH